MANKFKDIDPGEIIALAEEYATERIEHTKTLISNSGKTIEIEDRMLPTVKYWLMHWMKNKGYDFYTRQYFYEAISNEAHPLSDTLKSIRFYFDAISEDIVANEGKGIFYAKNRLGMHDKQHIENKTVDKFDFDND